MTAKKPLPKPAKVAAVHSLKELGFTQKQIAKILGVGYRSVNRYITQETDKEWLIFGETIKKIYFQQDFELAQLAVKHIKEKIETAKFHELVGLLKIVRELQQPKPAVAVQFNNFVKNEQIP